MTHAAGPDDHDKPQTFASSHARREAVERREHRGREARLRATGAHRHALFFTYGEGGRQRRSLQRQPFALFFRRQAGHREEIHRHLPGLEEVLHRPQLFFVFIGNGDSGVGARETVGADLAVLVPGVVT